MRESGNPKLNPPRVVAGLRETRGGAIAGPQYHAEAIRPGLREQSIGGLVSLAARSWRAVFLESGHLRLPDEAGGRRLPAPCFVWRRWTAETRIRAGAGSRGATLLLGDTMLANTIGHRAEAADIRLLLDRDFDVALRDHPDTTRGLSESFAQVLAEQQRDQQGSSVIVEAHARIVTVLIWRLSSPEDAFMSAEHRGSRLLQQFRQLLEAHFRERWQVAAYARALDITPDRLNDLCRRALGRTPKDLIQDRLIYEARILLERSTRTNDEIAAMLGYSDAAHFSKSFRSSVGEPPGRYRRLARSAGPPGDSAARGYADWP
jgi:AraC family transcriptional activator of pobA